MLILLVNVEVLSSTVQLLLLLLLIIQGLIVHFYEVSFNRTELPYSRSTSSK